MADDLERRFDRIERLAYDRDRRLAVVERSMRQIADDLRPVLHAFADDKRRGEARQKAWRIGFAVAGFVLGVPVFIASIVSLAHGGP